MNLDTAGMTARATGGLVSFFFLPGRQQLNEHQENHEGQYHQRDCRQ
jgi:hypothetical protein